MNTLDFLVYFNTVIGLQDISSVVAKKSAIDSDRGRSQLGKYLNLLINVFFENGFRIDQVRLIVLFKDSDTFGIVDSFEGNCLGFYPRGHICEV